MVNFRENESILTLSREDKSQLFYDAFGLASFLLLGLLLISPYKILDLTGDELTGTWLTALLGSVLFLFLILTKEHTKRWTFDKETSCLVIEYQGVGGSRRFEVPFDQIKSVQVIYLSGENTEIFLPDIEPFGASIGNIPKGRVNIYAKSISNFLKLNDSSL